MCACMPSLPPACNPGHCAGLLDAVDEPDGALPLLAMIPSVGSGHPLWPMSCLELAVDFGGSAMPCRRFVAHRHSQYLLEAFFTGDYPNSKARVPMDAHLHMILLQCVFFFVPGTFCEVCAARRAARRAAHRATRRAAAAYLPPPPIRRRRSATRCRLPPSPHPSPPLLIPPLRLVRASPPLLVGR